MNNTSIMTRKLAISAMVIAIYVIVMYFTSSFAFGMYQIRIATALYSLAYFFPFLIIPLGLANFISNILGGMGMIDMIGGCLVGMVTTSLVFCVRRFSLPKFLVAIPIVVVPGFGVSIWLCNIVGAPYLALAESLCIGQAIPAVVGVLLITALNKYVMNNYRDLITIYKKSEKEEN